MTGKMRRLTLFAAALAVLTAAGAASAAPSETLSPPGGARFKSPSVRVVPAPLTRALRVRSASRTQRAVLRAAASATTEALPAGEFPGFAFCGFDDAWIWPAYAPLHDMTLTRTHIAHSYTGDFTDAYVEPAPWYVIHVGPYYYYYEIDTAQIVWGPGTYAESAIQLLYGDPHYHAFVNEVFYVDNGIPSASTFTLLDVVYQTTAPYVCGP